MFKVGDIVRFTKLSRNYGKLAKIVEISYMSIKLTSVGNTKYATVCGTLKEEVRIIDNANYIELETNPLVLSLYGEG